ncbi:uncharacterized protein K452DRAFT_256336 [Aplosporella prunicola CBS 121167]|uniref:Ubiquinol-cytochrome c chaperone domain-containing protein n=1 Tax=Aplosporella prunicola CBS 121167 TaxID=1176127 RepID=A0A6A6B2F2_9PEZI|nr:uncharacterized protein K452DRAFT_256336 [Aplosporella prunicola CBS 121167]KAF2138230.1 hypothetical protein K452DRAFT_256336 [Aplosporella prunicola CBS 121167]
MASRSACRACRRALQLRAPAPQQQQTRYLSQTRAVLASQPYIEAQPAREGPAAVPDTSSPPPPTTTASQKLPRKAVSNVVAEQLRQRAGASTETYVAYGATELLFRECAAQAAYRVERDADGEAPKTAKGEDLGVGEGAWYQELNLTPTFATWAQVTFLHMHLLTTRLRQFPPAHAPSWQQHLIDHFSYAAEARMASEHNIVARAVRNKYLKDLFVQWRGVTAAYDEGLVRGDAVLAAALWRNLWKGEELRPRELAMLVAYVRREVARLGRLSDAEIAAGDVGFGDLRSERRVVDEKSTMMDKPFGADE